MPVALRADLEFMWGHASRQFALSKSPPSFIYPPPTTLLGALAASIARRMDLGESSGRELMRKISSKLLAVSVKPLNFVPIRYQDVNRIVAVKVTGGIHYPSPDRLAGSFDAPARGKTAFVSVEDGPPTLRVFFVFEDLNFGDFQLEEKDLWHIRRVGAKEALVSTVDVEIVDVKAEKGSFIVSSSFPLLDGVEAKAVMKGDWRVEYYLDPFDPRSYGPLTNALSGRVHYLKFMVPKSIPPDEVAYMVEIKGGAAAYRLEGDVVVGRA